MRFGKWEPIRDTSVSASTSALVSVLNFSYEAVISDVENDKPKKKVERKKYLQVVNILKKSISLTIIIKYILDLGVYLTIGRLLTLVPTIEK